MRNREHFTKGNKVRAEEDKQKMQWNKEKKNARENDLSRRGSS